MTADSNYEIRLLGAKVILNMAQQNTTQTKERKFHHGNPDCSDVPESTVYTPPRTVYTLPGVVEST